MITLKQYLKKEFQLMDGEIQEITSYFYESSLKKNSFFLKAGSRCDQVAFLKSGVMRNYYIDPKGNEIINYMTNDGDFNTVYNSFVERVICQENIQAVTDCHIHVINHQDFFLLKEKSAVFREIIDRLVVAGLACKEQRLRSYLHEDAQKRYENLLDQQPKIVQHSPMQYIASYLGITRETLSRIRNRRPESV
ncbi:MAG: Crp/Fnr family transcriptional regulator [Bacteroidota bacterium]